MWNVNSDSQRQALLQKYKGCLVIGFKDYKTFRIIQVDRYILKDKLFAEYTNSCWVIHKHLGTPIQQICGWEKYGNPNNESKLAANAFIKQVQSNTNSLVRFPPIP